MALVQFRYHVLDRIGRRRRGTLQAADRTTARSKLREQGWYVVDLGPARTSEARLRRLVGRPAGTSRKLNRQLADLTRQLAALLRAGVPVANGLATLSAEITHARLRQIVEELRRAVTEGRSFADALGDYPDVFDPVYRALAHAGEATGTLDQSLARLAVYLGKRLQLRDKLVSALAYPAMVACVGIFVAAFLVNYVVPKVLSVLEGSGTPLPVPTRILLALSHMTAIYWPVGIGLLLVLAVAGRWLKHNDSFRTRWDRVQLKLPAYGPLLVKQLVARLAQLMATLLSAGIPMGEALQLAGRASSNRALADLLEQARRRVVAGRTLAEGLDAGTVLPPSVVQMLVVGQQGGQLPEMFTELADDYQREVDLAAERFTALLEPVLIVCLAVVVGFIVLATMLPILELTSSLQAKGGMP